MNQLTREIRAWVKIRSPFGYFPRDALNQDCACELSPPCICSGWKTNRGYSNGYENLSGGEGSQRGIAVVSLGWCVSFVGSGCLRSFENTRIMGICDYFCNGNQVIIGCVSCFWISASKSSIESGITNGTLSHWSRYED